MKRPRAEPASSRMSMATGNKTRQATFREVEFRRISSRTRSSRTKKWQLLGTIMAIDPSHRASSSLTLLMNKMISINRQTHIRTPSCPPKTPPWSLVAQIERLYQVLKLSQAAFSTPIRTKARAITWGISVAETWGTWTYRTSNGHATRLTKRSCSIWVVRKVAEWDRRREIATSRMQVSLEVWSNWA